MRAKIVYPHIGGERLASDARITVTPHAALALFDKPVGRVVDIRATDDGDLEITAEIDPEFTELAAMYGWSHAAE